MGISIDELDERAEISPVYLGLIERGKRCTTARRLNKFIQILGITPNYLLRGEGNNSDSKKDRLLHKLQILITEENCDMYDKVFMGLGGCNLNEVETKELCIFLKASLRVLSRGNKISDNSG